MEKCVLNSSSKQTKTTLRIKDQELECVACVKPWVPGEEEKLETANSVRTQEGSSWIPPLTTLADPNSSPLSRDS